MWAIHFFNLDLLKSNNIMYDSNCILCEDFDITIQMLKVGLKSATYYKYAFDKAMNKGDGGCKKWYNDLEKLKENAYYLLKKHGGSIVKPFYHEEHKSWEIAVNWNMALKYNNHNWW